MRKLLLSLFLSLSACLLIGQNSSVVFQETFDDTTLPTGWYIDGLGSSNWSIVSSSYAGGNPNELRLYWNPQFNGVSRLVIPAIDMTEVDSLVLSFNHYLDNYSGSNTIGFATSSDDGETWHDVWMQTYSSDGLYNVRNTIGSPDFGHDNVMLSLYFTGNSYNIDYWYFDNLMLRSKSAYDDVEILYVKASGAGTKDGLSWDNAMDDLNTALNIASVYSIPNIWVAAGTYYGDGVSGNNAFTMVNGTNVYGGFVGNEPADYDITQRDLENNVTILDGQNVQRVLYQTNAFSTTTTWDGFTIRNGYLYCDANSTDKVGAGIRIYGNVVLNRCIVSNNTMENADSNSSSNGSGIYANNATISNCIIKNNSSFGFVIGTVSAYNSTVTNCIITNNGIQGNSYTGFGGGLSCGSTTVSNCLISNNTSYYGGGVYCYNTNIYNCNIVNNFGQYGSGVYCSSSNTIQNCILWGSVNGTIIRVNGTDTNVSYCAVEGGYAGDGNINLSSDNIGDGLCHPRFVNPSPTAGILENYEDYSWDLQEGSICINRGDITGFDVPDYDLAGNQRVQQGAIDMGCYESPYQALVLPTFNDGIVYVTENGSGTKSGVSWDNALDDFQLALSYANLSDCDVWIAAGTYYGDGVSGNNAFTMVDGANVYGGFVGNEPADYDITQRDLENNVTILDGQNVQRVLYQPNAFSTTTTWDGFSIKNGYISGSDYGAGAYVYGGVILSNLIVSDNVSESGSGGGMYIQNSVLKNSIIKNNSANWGGGISCYRSTVENCVFTNNNASGGGGAIYVWAGTINNCLIANNNSNGIYGGAVYSDERSNYGYNGGVFNNCDIVRNSSAGYSAIYNYQNGGTFKNCIIWGNESTDSNYSQISEGGTFSYCAIEGGSVGHGNIYLSSENTGNGLYHPRFVNPCPTAGVSNNSESYSWALQEGSICINRGDADGITLPDYDLAGNQRVQKSIIDIGCYESPYQTVNLYNSYIVYVKPNGSGTKDGSSWDNALNDLNVAVKIASKYSIYTVWAASGVYYGDGVSDHNAFTMLNGVNVYGGFVGNESPYYDLNLRDFEANETILDGQNVQRVLCQNEHFTYNTYWDGFTIQNGYHYSNESYDGGGGVYLLGKSRLLHCKIINNTLDCQKQGSGGGIFAQGTSSSRITIRDCIIANNTVIDNQAYTFTYTGGGIMSYYTDMTNCLIANNSARSGGGINCNASKLINCDIVNNKVSQGNGGGINYFTSSYYSTPSSFYNCIVWGNKKDTVLNNIYSESDVSESTFRYCAVEGGYEGEGNINLLSDNNGTGINCPRFANPSPTAGVVSNLDDYSWELLEESICINKGDVTGISVPTYDLAGNTRIQQRRIDIGCYESPYQAANVFTDGIIYVTQTGSGIKDGTSWDNAMDDINDALNTAFAYSMINIWVAEGVYYGDGISNNNAFNLVEGANMYGGFVGNEPANYDLSLRDLATHKTILDGNNVQRVVYQDADFTHVTEIDGFVVRNGRKSSNGGGGYFRNNIHINNVVFENNNTISYYEYGGGIYLSGNLSVVSNCVIRNNSAYDKGGGVYANSGTFINCLINNNNSSYYSGGGVYACGATFINCDIVNNSAKQYSGIHNEGNGGIFRNCIIWGNDINYGGNFINCAIESGGVQINCIPLVSDNMGEGIYHPRFVNPSPSAGLLDSLDKYSWALMDGSICVNHGDTTGLSLPDIDLLSNARIQQGIIDIGCCESPYQGIEIPDYDNGIVYVTQNGAGAKDGTSWDNAIGRIQDAINIANTNGAKVWAAAGVYYGDSIADHNAFTLADGVDVYGGFAGNEPSDYDLSLRDFATNKTILDGQNAQRVLYQPNDFETMTAIDGFTVRNGYIGNIYNNNAGGGAYLRNNIHLENLVFEGNQAYSSGGALYLYYGESSIITNCVFRNNKGSDGGAINMYNGGTVINCLIHNNQGSSAGGIYVSNPYYSSKIARIINCDIVNNTSTYTNNYNGSGIMFSNSNAIVENCIIWGNENPKYDYQIYGDCTVRNCAIQGISNGEDNIYLYSANEGNGIYYPRFVNPTPVAGLMDTIEGYSWQLQEGSVCINHGTIPSVEITDHDLNGNQRIQQGVIDIGCYESSYQGVELPTYDDGIVYVKHTNQQTGEGDSWNNATNSIQDAIYIAHSNSLQVWVAAGTYYGDSISTNTAFVLADGVNLYGGFSGDEPANYDLNLRDFETNVTILDGQNVQCVVGQSESFSNVTTLNGFTVRNGYSDYYSGRVAGGIDLRNNVVLENLIVENNHGRTSGGVYVGINSVVIKNCVLRYNEAEYYSGAIYAKNTSVINCLVHNNVAVDSYYNCAAVYSNGNLNVVNCNIVKNKSLGITSQSNDHITNSIIWGNEYNIYGEQIIGSGTVKYCAIQGDCDGEGNVSLFAENDGFGDGYPRFENPTSVAGITDEPIICSWHLTEGSACINMGSTEGITLPETDLDGNLRILDDIDIGCYELQYPTTCPVPTNLTVASITDTMVSLSWQGNSENYKLYYSKLNEDWNEVIVSDHSYNLDSITLFTTYRWGVRSLCSEADSSIFIYGPTFRTAVAEEPEFVSGSYNIYNVAQMLWIEGVVNGTITSGSDGVYPTGNTSMEGLTITLMNDIDMNEVSWIPIGNDEHPFGGIFDGNEHKIYSFTCTNLKGNYTGLFGYVSSSGEIKNLAVEADYIKGYNYVGSIAGYLEGSCVNCSNVSNSANSLVSGGTYIGGLFGYANDASIQSVYNLSNVTSNDSYVGGIVGYGTGITLTNAYNRGVVSGVSYVGGIVGYLSGSYYEYNISNTYVTAQVSGTGQNIGAISGCNYGSISNSYYLTGICQNSGSGTSMALATMQNSAFVSLLNASQSPEQWKSDYNPPTNDGFPVLNWQSLEHLVTYTQPEHGSVIVKNGNIVIKSGSRVADNTTLTVYATPILGYSLNSISVNGVVITGNNFIVTESVEIEVDLIISLPELHVISLSSSGMIAGQQATVSWTVKNDGDGATPNGTIWYDRVWLTHVPFVELGQTNPILLGEYANMSSLAPGESYTQTKTVDIPLTAEGPYYLFVITDSYEARFIQWDNDSIPNPYNPPPYYTAYGWPVSDVLEASEYYNGLWYHDNFFYKIVEVQLPPLPDLQVSLIGVEHFSFFSGTNNLIMFNVKNNGFATTNVEDWVDAIFISTDSEFNENAVALAVKNHHGALAPYSTYSETVDCFVPYEFWGETAYFYIYTDVNNQVYENYLDDNNVSRSTPVSVTLSPTPDLVVTSLTNSKNVIGTYDAFTIDFSVYNQGAGATHNTWCDRLYLSANPDEPGTDKINVYTYYNSIKLFNAGSGAQTSYTKSNINIDLSNNQQVHNLDEGTYYLYMHTDADNNVFEYNADDNNILRSTGSIAVIKPDLVVENASIPATVAPDHQYEISYNLKNNRNSSIRNVGVANIIKLSANSDMSNAIVLNNENLNLTLNGNESLSITKSVMIPRTLAEGMYYLSIMVDANNNINEYNETNNVHIGSINLEMLPLPDLTPLSMNIPSVITAGDTIDVSFQIANIGNSDLNNSYCSIEVYGSINEEFDAVTSKLCEAVSEINPVTINAGESILIEGKFMANASMTSDYNYMHLVIDLNDELFELDENNNVINHPVTTHPYPFDLSITANTVTVCDAGQSIPVAWTVENLGTKPVVSSFFPTYIMGVVIANWSVNLVNPWFDKVYLSDDNVLSSDDRVLLAERHNTVLFAGQDYTVSLNVNMPYNVYGDKYLIFVTDSETITLDNDRTNNAVIKPISILPIATPDLIVTNICIDDPLYVGQPYMLKYTVMNDGDALTPQSRWADAFYIDDEFNLSGAVLLGSKIHNGSLEVGASYTDSLEVYIPNRTGVMVVMAKTDATNQVFEDTDEDNNLLGVSVNVMAPQSVDMVASQPSFDSPATLGENLTITWSVINQLYTSTSGILRDAVYISSDNQWDSNDYLVGYTESNVNIASAGQIQQSLNVTLTGVTDGSYYIIVRTNIQNTIPETDYSNNTTVSISPIVVACNELNIGSSDNRSLNDGQYVYYKIAVGSEHVGETMMCQLQSSSIDINNGLYIAHNRLPSVSSYDYYVTKPLDNNLEVVVPVLETGTYYLMAKGSTSSQSAQNIEVSASIINFEILSVNSNHGTNTGYLTTQITGAKFDTIMDFRLKMGDVVIPADDVSFDKTTESYATFNLKDVPLGVYDLIAELPGGIITVKDNAFTVDNASPSLMRYRINMPASARYGTDFIMSVQCTNTSSIDLDIIGYLLVSENGHTMQDITNGVPTIQIQRIVNYFDSNGTTYKPLNPGGTSTKQFQVQTQSVPIGDVHMKVFPIRLIH